MIVSEKQDVLILYIIFFASSFVIGEPLRSQVQIGIEAGISKNILITNLSSRPALSYCARPGIVAAVPVKYQWNNWLSIRVSPTYIEKNTRLSNDSIRSLYHKSRNIYIQIPFASLFTIGYKQLKFSIELGGYKGYWLMGHVKGKAANFLNISPFKYSERYIFNPISDRRWESGWLAGSEINFYVRKNYPVYIHYSFYQSLTDQQKKNMFGQVPRYNRTHALTLGCPISSLSSK